MKYAYVSGLMTDPEFHDAIKKLEAESPQKFIIEEFQLDINRLEGINNILSLVEPNDEVVFSCLKYTGRSPIQLVTVIDALLRKKAVVTFLDKNMEPQHPEDTMFINFIKEILFYSKHKEEVANDN